MPLNIVPIVPGAAEGYYAKRAKMLSTAGQDSFDAENRLDSMLLIADETVVQLALTAADSVVDGIAYEEGIDGTTHAILTTDQPVFGYLSFWASRWARAEGHLTRGEISDAEDDIEGGPPNGSPEGVFRKMKTEAEKRIRAILVAKRGRQSIVGTGGHGIAVGYQPHVRPSCGIDPTVKG